MLDMRRITAATAVASALALPAAATASDGSDGYRGIGAQTVAGENSLLTDSADGYRGLGAQPVASEGSLPSDSADGYRGLGPHTDTPVTPVVHVIDAPREQQFNWGDAGIGAGGSLAVIAMAGGIALVATGRRRSTRRVATTG